MVSFPVSVPLGVMRHEFIGIRVLRVAKESDVVIDCPLPSQSTCQPYQASKP